MALQIVWMAITNRFKKDFGYYLLGVIIPGLLNAAIIPIIKHLLGTEIFGAYSLKFNFLLLLMATLIGGICQGVIRFKVDAENNITDFYKQVFSIFRYLLIPVVTICFLIFYFYLHQTFLLSLVFACCIIGGSLQNVLMAISQANFHSKFIMLSEGIRAFAFVVLSIIVLSIIKSYPQEILFSCLFISYAISDVMMARKNNLPFTYLIRVLKPEINNFDKKAFLFYGLPFSLCASIYYLFTYLDKPLLAHDFGLTIQGNYQAMFDIIFRGITGIMSPFPIAALPILTHAYQQGNSKNAFGLLQKLIIVQIAIMLIGAVFYWFWGFNILANILAVPTILDFKISGLIMALACMVWQIGLLNQKPYELAKRIDLMLKNILVCLIIYLIIFVIIRSSHVSFFYYYSLPFLISGIFYNILCLFFSKKLIGEINL